MHERYQYVGYVRAVNDAKEAIWKLLGRRPSWADIDGAKSADNNLSEYLSSGSQASALEYTPTGLAPIGKVLGLVRGCRVAFLKGFLSGLIDTRTKIAR